jgi:hypothetical protein
MSMLLMKDGKSHVDLRRKMLGCVLGGPAPTIPALTMVITSRAA